MTNTHVFIFILFYSVSVLAQNNLGLGEREQRARVSLLMIACTQDEPHASEARSVYENEYGPLLKKDCDQLKIALDPLPSQSANRDQLIEIICASLDPNAVRVAKNIYLQKFGPFLDICGPKKIDVHINNSDLQKEIEDDFIKLRKMNGTKQQ